MISSPAHVFNRNNESLFQFSFLRHQSYLQSSPPQNTRIIHDTNSNPPVHINLQTRVNWMWTVCLLTGLSHQQRTDRQINYFIPIQPKLMDFISHFREVSSSLKEFVLHKSESFFFCLELAPKCSNACTVIGHLSRVVFLLWMAETHAIGRCENSFTSIAAGSIPIW